MEYLEKVKKIGLKQKLKLINYTLKNNLKFNAIFNQDVSNSTTENDVVGKHRYYLFHEFNENKSSNILTVIMENPSKTYPNGDFDQTIKNVIEIAKDNNYGAIEVINLYSYITGKSEENKEHNNKFPNANKENENFIENFLRNSSNDILIAWGSNYKNDSKKSNKIKELLNEKHVYTFCENTENNFPKHPGRISLDCCRNCYGRCGEIALLEYNFNKKTKNYTQQGTMEINKNIIKQQSFDISQLANKILNQDEIDKLRKQGESYPYQDIETISLQDEEWKFHPEGKYEVSSLGRIKYKEEILPQCDKGEQKGWLIIGKSHSADGVKLNTTKYIYRFVAETWLEKDFSQSENLGRWEVHHISNDGYDNSIDNLIWLRQKLHQEIHNQKKN